MTNKEILETIIRNEGITYAELARKMGLKGQPTQLYDIRDGKIKSITLKTAEKIVSAFPNYNRTWLLTGEGSPFKNAEKESSAENKIPKRNANPATIDIFYLLDIMNQIMDELDTIKSQNRSLMKEILELKANTNKEKEIG